MLCEVGSSVRSALSNCYARARGAVVHWSLARCRRGIIFAGGWMDWHLFGRVLGDLRVFAGDFEVLDCDGGFISEAYMNRQQN